MCQFWLNIGFTQNFNNLIYHILETKFKGNGLKYIYVRRYLIVKLASKQRLKHIIFGFMINFSKIKTNFALNLGK